MKVKDFYAMIEKAKAQTPPEQMEQEMELYVSNPHSIHDMQSGEYGVTPRLIDAFVSCNTLHVMGG
jgi:hypothetical protein